MKIEILSLALSAGGKVVDLVTSDDRTYQVSGDRRFAGTFERLFHAGSNPTRRRVGTVEAQAALDRAVEIRLWVEPNHFQILSNEELENLIPAFMRG